MNNYEIEDKKIFDVYCKKYKYYPSIISSKKRIIVFGDLHGDFDLTIRLLKLAKLVDSKNSWIGNDTYVVQVGDQLDNCRPNEKKCNELNSEINEYVKETEAEDIKLLKFLTKLDMEANKYNGAVISLLGNHEIMNVMGNMNYVSYNDVEKFKNYVDKSKPSLKFNSGKEGRIHAFKPGNEYAKLLACTRIPAIIIGSFIFVHAGIINEFVEKLDIKNRNDLFKINYIMRKWLLNMIDKNNVINIINNANYSMFWDRILGAIPPNMNNNDPKCVKYLDKVLQLFKVDKMIIGHTPQFVHNNKGINSTCGEKLWRVDFGGSFGFNKFDESFNKNKHIDDSRKAQILEILNDSEINILKEN